MGGDEGSRFVAKPNDFRPVGALRVDWVAEGDGDPPGAQQQGIGGPDVAGAVDGDRDDRAAGVYGGAEGA